VPPARGLGVSPQGAQAVAAVKQVAPELPAEYAAVLAAE
jgi:hypothetical protein